MDQEVSASSSESSSSPSTSDIAASVIADAESSSSESASAAPAAKADATPAPEADPDDFDAIPSERVDAIGRTRENAIPHSRVKAMIARREQKLIATVAKELGITKAEAELKLEDVTGALTERGTKLSEYEKHRATTDSIEQIMASDADRFIRMLSQAMPEKYAKFAKVLEQVTQQAAAAPAQAVDDDPEPQPDYDLGNGQMTRSLKNSQEHDAWLTRRVRKELLGEVEQRFQPFEQERQQREKAEQERQRLAKIHAEASTKIEALLERMSKRPGWKANEAEIQKLVVEQGMSVEDAYDAVVMPKLAVDRTKMRQELLDEINKAPRTTSASAAGAAGVKPSSGPKSTADLARETIAEFSR